MNTTKIAEIASLEDGQLVMRVEGELVKAFDLKSGVKKNGDAWSVQTFFVKDESGEIRVQAWDHSDIQPLVHKQVSITAHNSSKGWSSVYANDDTYKDVKTRQLKVTAAGEIKALDEPQDAIPASTDAPRTAPEHRKALTPPPEHQNDSTGFEYALQRICNAQYIIKREVRKQWEQAAVDRVIPEFDTLAGNAHFQADCSSAFIKLDRAGEVCKLSAKPVWRDAKQEAGDW